MIMTEIHAVIERHIIFMVRMARATYHGVKDLLTKRPFIITRSAYAGARTTVPLGPDNAWVWVMSMDF
jgi:alpha-glucosidase (family GH31 glycosyl hydrolase)